MDVDAEHQLAEMIEKARSGCSQTLGLVLEHFRWRLLSAAHHYLRTALQSKLSVSDLVQDTFLEAQQDLSQFRGKTVSEFFVWLLRILRNNVRNAWRDFSRGKRNVRKEVRTCRSDDWPGLSPLEETISRERSESVQRNFAALPEKQQYAIHAFVLERQSFRKIGEQLGCSAEAARKVCNRGLNVLRQGPLRAFSG